MTTFNRSKDDVLNETQEFGAGDVLFSTLASGELQLPRYSSAERDAIVNPKTFSVIGNTSTSKINFYNGSAWEEVTSA